MFEIHYAFDIDSLKKENLGKAIQHLSKFQGITPFVVAYLTQVGLGGHAIPIDKATAALFSILDLVTPKEALAFQVPGLERAIPKTKGAEFFSCVHQLAASLYTSPFNTEIRNIVLEIDAQAKPRLPKRGGRKGEPAGGAAEPPSAKHVGPAADKTKRDKEKRSVARKKVADKPAAPPAKSSKSASRKAAGKSKSPKAPSATRQLTKKKPR
jgi:endonuclease-3